MFLQIKFSDGLSWPSISFIILAIALLLITVVLWRRFRSRQTLMRRISELEALSAAGRAIVESQQDIDALSELIAYESGKVIDNSTFQVGIFDGDLYHILFWQINGVKEKPRSFDLSNNRGMVGWVRENKQPLIVNDFQKEFDTLPSKPRYVSDTPPRSAIFLPLLSGDTAIGILAAQHHLPNRFSEDDLRRLMIIANQSGAAFANAQLFKQVEERASHLELLGRLAREIDRIHDVDVIFEQIVTLTEQTFGFNPVSIFLLDSATNEAVLKASSDAELAKVTYRVPLGHGLVGTAVSQQKTIISNDVTNDPRYQPHLETPPPSNISTKSEIVIPIQTEKELLGILDVQSNQIGAFGDSEQLTLETLAVDAARSIEKARQINRQQERAWLTTAQLQIAQAISQNPDTDSFIPATTRLTSMLVGATFCGVLVWNYEFEAYRWVGGFAEHHETLSDIGPINLTVGVWPALDAVHVGKASLTTQRIPAWIRPYLPPDTNELALHPILAMTDQVGVLILHQAKQPEEKSARQRRQTELITNITNQLGQAIDNANLRTAQQEEAWVNTALLQVAEAVNNLIDLQEILGTIVRLVPMLVGVETTLILIWNEEHELFQVGPTFGMSEMGIGLLQTLALDRVELNQLVTQEPEPSQTVNFFKIDLADWFKKALVSTAAFAFPLRARGQLVGVLIIGTNEQTFTTRRLNILNGIAHQAATAVVNNQLYQESAERSRLEQELNVAREIQASLIPPGNPNIPKCSVASYWEAARQVSGDFYDFLPLNDNKWGIVVADVADKGVPAALFMALCRTILRTVAFNRSDPAKTLVRVNEIIDKDAQSDLFVTLFYAIWDSESGKLTYANGGHNPPILIRANGKHRLLKSEGIALGVLPHVRIVSESIDFHKGDVLIFYTDGVTEAMNEDYDEFDMPRLIMTATQSRKHDANTIMNCIHDAINEHVGFTAQSDDITLVVMKREE